MAPRMKLAALVLGLLTLVASAEAQDPATPGPLAVTRTSYDFGDSAFTATGIANPVELRAEVHHPTNLAAGPFPLAVFLHGRHNTCFNGAVAGGGWPCVAPSQPIPSHQGYRYIAESLASNGFIVVSISANGINAGDSFAPDLGALARAELIQRHLEQWRTFNTAGAAPFGTQFVGRVDLQRIGTMGHSRGGEGIVRHYVLNQAQGAPFGVRAVVPLAPTDFSRFVINNVALGVILPYCDGDVADLQGVHFFDDARYNVAGDRAGKHTFLIDGANHNFFNVNWTTGLFAGGSDDFGFADPHCGPAAAGRLTPEEQRGAGRAYITGLLRAYVKNESEYLPFLTGAAAPPPSALTPDIYPSYHPPDNARLRRVVNRFEVNSERTTNRLGGAVVASSLNPYTSCGGAELAQPAQCLAGQPSYRQPHTTPSLLSASRGLGQLHFGWLNSSASLRNDLPAGSRDVSGFSTLQFRVGLDYTSALNPVGATRDFSVVLRDGLGRTASVRVGSVSSPLFYPPGQNGPVPKLFQNMARVALSSFSGISLTDVRSIEFRFDRQATGALAVSDLEFTNPEGISVPLNNLFGEATTLPLPAGQMNFNALFTLPAPIDLRTSSVRFLALLKEGATERAANVPMALSPLPGATADLATYFALGLPGVTLTLAHTGGGTYAVTFTVFTTAIQLPSTCSIFGGVANLTTSIAIETPSSPRAVASTQETWFCTPAGTTIVAF